MITPAWRGAVNENAFRSARLIQHDIMNQKSAGLSPMDRTALREHLLLEPDASLQTASRLGGEALTLGLQALALARIHERARALLEPRSREKASAVARKSLLPSPPL